MIFIRAETGYFAEGMTLNSDPAHHLAADLERCFEFFINNVIYDGRAIKHLEETRAIDSKFSQDTILKACEMGLEGAKSEIEECFDLDEEIAVEIKNSTIEWLKLGYRKAKKRYGDNNLARMLFEQISREVDTIYAEQGD